VRKGCWGLQPAQGRVRAAPCRGPLPSPSPHPLPPPLLNFSPQDTLTELAALLTGQLDMQQLRQLAQQMGPPQARDGGAVGPSGRGAAGGGGGGEGGEAGLQVAEGVKDDPELLALIQRRGGGGGKGRRGGGGRGGGTAPMTAAERRLRSLLRPLAVAAVAAEAGDPAAR
jgi:hypothetical protein